MVSWPLEYTFISDRILSNILPNWGSVKKRKTPCSYISAKDNLQYTNYSYLPKLWDMVIHNLYFVVQGSHLHVIYSNDKLSYEKNFIAIFLRKKKADLWVIFLSFCLKFLIDCYLKKMTINIYIYNLILITCIINQSQNVEIVCLNLFCQREGAEK